jgi:hypothetical protein
MKKFLVVSLMLVLLGGFVAAQGGTDEAAPELGVSAEVTGNYDIVNYTAWKGDGDVPKNFRDTLAGATAADGTITFTAQDEAAGVKIVIDVGELFAENLTWANDNAANVWFKPLKNDLLTIRAGAKPGDGTLQYGDLSSQPNNIVPGDFGRVIVEDYVYGFGGAPYGLIITSSPIPNLFIGLGWKASLTGGTKGTGLTTYGWKDHDDTASTAPQWGPSTDGDTLGYPRLGDNYIGIQLGFGYTIEGIGSARLQYYGPFALENDTTKENDGYNSLLDVHPVEEPAAKDAFTLGAYYAGYNFNYIQGGFKVTALESIGLDLDVVAKIPLPFAYKTTGKTITANGPIKIGVVAAFATGNISVNGGIGVGLPYTAASSAILFDSTYPDKPVENDAIELKFNVEPALKIGDSVTVGADIALVVDPNQASGFKVDGNYLLASKNDVKVKLGTPMDLGLGAFVKYAIGKGTLKTGIAVTVPNLGGLDLEPDDDTWHNAVNFKIPLSITVGF